MADLRGADGEDTWQSINGAIGPAKFRPPFFRRSRPSLGRPLLGQRERQVYARRWRWAMLEANRHCLLAAPIAVEMRRGLNGSMGRKERAEPSLTRRRDRLSDPGGEYMRVDHTRGGALLQRIHFDPLQLYYRYMKLMDAALGMYLLVSISQYCTLHARRGCIGSLT